MVKVDVKVDVHVTSTALLVHVKKLEFKSLSPSKVLKESMIVLS